jgi:hypothetical protein
MGYSMTEKRLNNVAIFKALLWIWLFCFLLLVLSIGLVYAFNKHVGFAISFETILFYVLLAAVLLSFPFLSKARISYIIFNKTLMAAFLDRPILSPQEWRLFFIWHGLLIAFLLVLFIFCRPYLFTLHHFFGDGRKNPAVFIFTVTVLALQYGAWLLHNKMTAGDWHDDKHPQQVMTRRSDIAGSILLASAPIIFISWIVMMMITRHLSL